MPILNVFRSSEYSSFLFASGLTPDRDMKTPHHSAGEDVPEVQVATDNQVLWPAEREENDLEQADSKAVFNSKKALWAFLVLCYSVSDDLQVLIYSSRSYFNIEVKYVRPALPLPWSQPMSLPLSCQRQMFWATRRDRTSPARAGAQALAA